jgi:hypothetical protein
VEKEQNEKLCKEFSPQFLANGIAGMFNTGEYESVEVRITFYKKRSVENSGAATTDTQQSKPKKPR